MFANLRGIRFDDRTFHLSRLFGDPDLHLTQLQLERIGRNAHLAVRVIEAANKIGTETDLHPGRMATVLLDLCREFEKEGTRKDLERFAELDPDTVRKRQQELWEQWRGDRFSELRDTIRKSQEEAKAQWEQSRHDREDTIRKQTEDVEAAWGVLRSRREMRHIPWLRSMPEGRFAKPAAADEHAASSGGLFKPDGHAASSRGLFKPFGDGGLFKPDVSQHAASSVFSKQPMSDELVAASKVPLPVWEDSEESESSDCHAGEGLPVWVKSRHDRRSGPQKSSPVNVIDIDAQ